MSSSMGADGGGSGGSCVTVPFVVAAADRDEDDVDDELDGVGDEDGDEVAGWVEWWWWCGVLWLLLWLSPPLCVEERLRSDCGLEVDGRIEVGDS